MNPMVVGKNYPEVYLKLANNQLKIDNLSYLSDENIEKEVIV